LRDLFFNQCRRHAAATAYVVLADDLSPLAERTFGELERDVRRLASALAVRTQRGDRVLLALDNGLDSAELFWACLVAGLVPIPAPAPSSRGLGEAGLKRLEGIAENAQAALVVTTAEGLKAFPEAPSSTWISREALDGSASPLLPDVVVGEADLAYLQYTSGSTSAPRGVELTHANVLAHYASLQTTLVAKTEGPHKTLNWLPWFHDFGLLQGVISPVYFGVPSYLMPAGVFLRRPLRWLEAIGRYKVTYSGAPDAAYFACVSALARSPSWSADLSSWRVATCGAEMVRADTLTAFTRAFAPHGFQPTSFFPAYGLAEAVLGVSIKPADAIPEILRVDAEALESNRVEEAGEENTHRLRALVGCGEPLDGLDVRIVDPERREECAPYSVGEIWVRGGTIAQGYWGDPEASRETFRGVLASGGGGGEHYLRTGDLGFFHRGQLFITGRLKDLVVVHGRNLYPQDIELTVQGAHGTVRGNGVIAFGIDRAGGEAVVILAECSGHLNPAEARTFIADIRRVVSAAHGVEVYDVVPLKRGALPQTSSGKLQRTLARKRYLDGVYDSQRLPAEADLAERRNPRDATERIVADAWMAVLGVETCDVEADFFSQGGNSLLATQLVSRLNAAFGADLPIHSVFETPTIAGLSAAIRGQPQVPAASREARFNDGGPTAAGESRLSFSQERMWFMYQQAPESTAYHMPLAIRMRGPLNVAALEAAAQRIVERHDILRTTFESTPSGVVARVHRNMPIVVRRGGLPRRPGLATEAALDEHLSALVKEPFDLARGPLMRVHAIEIGPDDTVLLIVKHHIIGDQWSYAVLAREAAHFYRMFVGEEAEPLPPLGLQYAEFAARQRQMFEGERRAREKAYWESQLAGLEPLAFPPDFPRPAGAVFDGARVRVAFDPELTAQLTALGARHGASLSMVLVAALKALLYRYTGHRDIAIGVPIANRHHAASEALIGTFVNMLVLRTELDDELDFAELLARVRRTTLDAFSHQDMPFELLVQSLAGQREGNRTPLFEVAFNMINVPVGKLDFPKLELSRVDFDRQATQFDLAVVADPEHDRSIVFEYATELFRRDTIERLAAQFMKLLQDIVGSEKASVADLVAPDQAERAKVLKWGRGRQLVLRAETVDEWLRPAFIRSTDATAVIFKGRSITYRELDEASSAVAVALNRRGIGRGQRVGLYVDRSIEMLVAQLGVLKSGAAYVPLDPINPPARLSFMARDAGLAFILGTSAGGAPLDWATGIPFLSVTDAEAEARHRNEEPPTIEARAKPDDAAYVMYTSGSTGEPKGVVVSHRSVVNILSSIAIEPGLDDRDRILSVSSLSFDISVIETLLPLGVGATIVLAGGDDVTDGAALRGLIETQTITVMQATPSTWYLVIEAGWKGSQKFKKALVGGESLPVDLAAALCERCDEVWNMYGPTETTVWSTAGRVVEPERQGISIGRPVANTHVYVLDSKSRLCPVGVEGELWIGGAGVSQGYVNRPGLTAERFVPDRFEPDVPGARLYRTGDRARWRQDGTLELFGRTDTQIKLRGHRIELAEIESALARESGVARAVVAVRDFGPGDRRLVAYVVPKSKSLSEESLREQLRGLLPVYMVPQHFVMLETLPLLASGKVDRASLPSPRLSPAARLPVHPRTEMERAVWRIWSEVLGREDFGIKESFFDLGGHSMLAVRLVNRIASEVTPSCTLALFSHHPTIESLCRAMVSLPYIECSSAVTLQGLGDGPTLFCICGVHIYRELADRLAPHIPVIALFVPCEIRILNGEIDPSSYFISVEELASDYIEVMRKKQPHGPYHLAGLSFGGLLAFEIAHQLRSEGERVDLLAMFDTTLPESRLRGLVRRAVRFVEGFREEGLIHGLRRGRVRLDRLRNAIRAWSSNRTAVSDISDIEDARRVALRDTIYMRAVRRYVARPYDGRAIHIRAQDSLTPDTSDGWSALVDQLEVIRIPGDHIGILKSPDVEVVAEHLLRRLRTLASDDAHDGIVKACVSRRPAEGSGRAF